MPVPRPFLRPGPARRRAAGLSGCLAAGVVVALAASATPARAATPPASSRPPSAPAAR